MIQINRGPKPESLTKPNIEFRENDYKNEDVRTAMKDMQHRKCCYCERNLEELDEIEKEGEHFVPRSSPSHKNAGETQWHLVNDWSNLMLACRACNGTKLGNPPFDAEGIRLIIDPTDLSINPENEIKFKLKIDIFFDYDTNQSSNLGAYTIEKIGLTKRTFLKGKFRKSWIIINDLFLDLITAIENQDGVQINEFKQQIKDISKANKPFTAFHRAVVQQRLEKLNNVDIPFLEETQGRSINPINLQLYTGYRYE